MHLKKILIDHEKYPVKDRYLFNLKVFQGTKEMEFHSPIILSCPEAQIFSFDSVPIERIVCEETEHYRIYRDFMIDPARFFCENIRFSSFSVKKKIPACVLY